MVYHTDDAHNYETTAYQNEPFSAWLKHSAVFPVQEKLSV